MKSFTSGGEAVGAVVTDNQIKYYVLFYKLLQKHTLNPKRKSLYFYYWANDWRCCFCIEIAESLQKLIIVNEIIINVNICEEMFNKQSE